MPLHKSLLFYPASQPRLFFTVLKSWSLGLVGSVCGAKKDRKSVGLKWNGIGLTGWLAGCIGLDPYYNDSLLADVETH